METICFIAMLGAVTLPLVERINFEPDFKQGFAEEEYDYR